MVHGVIIRMDNTRIEQDYHSMDEYMAEVQKHQQIGLKFLSADTIRWDEIRQGRRK